MCFYNAAVNHLEKSRVMNIHYLSYIAVITHVSFSLAAQSRVQFWGEKTLEIITRK
jgi:hypothetical protein